MGRTGLEHWEVSFTWANRNSMLVSKMLVACDRIKHCPIRVHQIYFLTDGRCTLQSLLSVLGLTIQIFYINSTTCKQSFHPLFTSYCPHWEEVAAQFGGCTEHAFTQYLFVLGALQSLVGWVGLFLWSWYSWCAVDRLGQLECENDSLACPK